MNPIQITFNIAEAAKDSFARMAFKTHITRLARTVIIAFTASLPLGVIADSKVDAADVPIDFNRDIRPILSENCFHCHGPDAKKRKADLRLDTKEGAFKNLDGYHAFVAGKPNDSEAYLLITSDDKTERMPPRKSGLTLKPEQIALIKRWIEQGATWSKHWSFETPLKAALPVMKDKAWAKNPIDHFIGKKLEGESLSPSARADKETLLRRAALTLTALPPSPELRKAFLADTSPDAYTKLIDKLLASPRYGERMAWFWLDAARYADTDGYQNDAPRTMWPWRDWVIKAFNDNMPFDQFTIEQIGGDMLPNRTPLQQLASGFNRNHRLNSEGGALPEEFIVEYAIDRLETTGAVWLGLTIGCARCHDHKYDPITQKEFYQLYAYFNSIAERGTGKGSSAPPIVKMGSPLATASKALQGELVKAKQALARSTKLATTAQRKWEITGGRKLLSRPSDWLLADVTKAASEKGGTLTRQSDGVFQNTGKNITGDSYLFDIRLTQRETKTINALMLEVFKAPQFTKQFGFARSSNGNFLLSGIEVTVNTPGKAPQRIKLVKPAATHSQPKYPFSNALDGKPNTGWAVAAHPANTKQINAMVMFDKPVTVQPGTTLQVRMRHDTGAAQHHVGRVRLSVSDRAQPKLPKAGKNNAALIAALRVPYSKRTKQQAKTITDYYLTIDPTISKAKAVVTSLEQRIKAAAGPTVNVMVMQENAKPTPAYLLNRGQYDEPDKSQVLSRKLPEGLINDAATKAKGPSNRLELGQWLVSKNNPLTARVIVNRIWQQHFGVGIVKTSEDFGSQGEWPSHPQLLDWLAVDFMEHGWDVKRLHKLILTSATFTQSSKVTKTRHRKDPENRLLARGPRYRLDGATIRDNALYLSGLINHKIGGPPVKPYQPTGLWSVVAGGAGKRYAPSKGEDLYRRSLYTYWKRAVNPPRMLIFDASGREACNVRNRVTNTPLQSLVLMNDPTFVEAARGFAERIIKTGGKTPSERITTAFTLTTQHKPSAAQLKVLEDNFAYFKTHFAANEADAKAFVTVGQSKRDETLNIVEHAAYTATAHLILNLDETITLE